MENKEEKVFDALLKIAAEEAFKQETESLPSWEQMNLLHKPSLELEVKIKKLISKEQASAARKKTFRYLGYTAAGIAIFFAAMTTVLLSVEASRNYIFNTIIEWRESHTSFDFIDSKKENAKISDYVADYIPDNFNIVQYNASDYASWYLYENEAGEQIIISVDFAESVSISVDNDGTDYSETTIKDIKIHLFEAKTERDMSILILPYDQYVIQITANIETSEIIKIAESFIK